MPMVLPANTDFWKGARKNFMLFRYKITLNASRRPEMANRP